MDLILAAKGKCVSLLQIFIFFIACLHPCISFHCARRTVLLPLVNMAIHYLKWQVLLQYAVTCLRFWADQNLTGFLLIFLFFPFSFHPQEISFSFSHLICKSDHCDVFPNFWSTGNCQEAAVDQCHRAVHVNIMVMPRSQLGPWSSGPAASHIPCQEGEYSQTNLLGHVL